MNIDTFLTDSAASHIASLDLDLAKVQDTFNRACQLMIYHKLIVLVIQIESFPNDVVGASFVYTFDKDVPVPKEQLDGDFVELVFLLRTLDLKGVLLRHAEEENQHKVNVSLMKRDED